MVWGVVPEFGQTKPFTLLFGTSDDETPEIGLQTLLYPFLLYVCLQVVSSAHRHLFFGQVEQGLPKAASEDFISI
jgi:hypothetical protein